MGLNYPPAKAGGYDAGKCTCSFPILPCNIVISLTAQPDRIKYLRLCDIDLYTILYLYFAAKLCDTLYHISYDCAYYNFCTFLDSPLRLYRLKPLELEHAQAIQTNFNYSRRCGVIL